MYSGSLLTRHSGNWIGAHQKFNKVAYRLLFGKIEIQKFPDLNAILHFEGDNGPDALKYKSSGRHEPSHFYDPVKGEGTVVDEIDNHYRELVRVLRNNDKVRAAFEASWLAHAITDGLTPAHHYPYEAELHELRSGELVKQLRDKMIIRGRTRTQTVRSTWKYIGAKGLITTHIHFELGVAAAVATWKGSTVIDRKLLETAYKHGPVAVFKRQARDIAGHALYEKFAKTGWTIGLARGVRRELAPKIATTIAIAWMAAYHAAQAAGNKK